VYLNGSKHIYVHNLCVLTYRSNEGICHTEEVSPMKSYLIVRCTINKAWNKVTAFLESLSFQMSFFLKLPNPFSKYLSLFKPNIKQIYRYYLPIIYVSMFSVQLTIRTEHVLLYYLPFCLDLLLIEMSLHT